MRLALQRFPLLIMIALVIGWQLATPFGARTVLNRLDHVVYDWRLQLAAALQSETVQAAQSNVVIVDIDEESIRQQGRWPWSRQRIAQLLSELQRAGATVVAFDMVFSEAELNQDFNRWLQTQLSEGQLGQDQWQQLQQRVQQWNPDRELAEVMARGDTVLGYFMHPDYDAKVGQLGPGLAPVPDNQVLVQAKGYTAPIAPLQQAAVANGFVTTFADGDGVIRRTPLVMTYQGQAYPSLALATVMVYLLVDDIGFSFQPLGQVAALSELKVTQQGVLTDAQGRVLVPFRQGRFHFPYVSATQVLEGGLDDQQVAGKLVFVGTSSQGLADLVNTPLATAFPGVEVHALVAEALLESGFPYRPVWMPGALLVFQLLLVVLGLWLFSRRRPWVMVLAAVLLNSLLIGTNLWLWLRWQMDVPFVSSFLLVQLLFAWFLVAGFVREYAREKKVRSMFGQYIPAAHIERLLSNPEHDAMAGESKELTVLFSDIRSFTIISEQLSATQLKQLLNLYFTPITAAIFQQGGTIDKYVGDMVMAFWGAPLDDPEHRRNALLAAMEMQRITRRLGPELAARQLPEVRVGIGLNTGVMNVGDMGSEFRKAYTVLGDAVNLGSRLESLTKYYGVDILVGESTIEGVDDMLFRFCDRIQVKGKTQPVDTYEPLGLKEAVSGEQQQQLARYQHAIELYQQQQWSQARDILNVLVRSNPDCRLYALYLERIAAMEQDPPSADWDGVFIHVSK